MSRPGLGSPADRGGHRCRVDSGRWLAAGRDVAVLRRGAPLAVRSTIAGGPASRPARGDRPHRREPRDPRPPPRRLGRRRAAYGGDRERARGADVTVVIGTAGHIDHGKTTLLRALTGIDADRLP